MVISLGLYVWRNQNGALSRILAIGFSDPFEVGLLSWLELQAMLDVYDAYGDKKSFLIYAVAYADTMIHQDGSIENL